MNKVVFDVSAILALLNQEEGSYLKHSKTDRTIAGTIAQSTGKNWV